MQLKSSCRNSSQPQDGISLNSYPAARTRFSHRMESAVTCKSYLAARTQVSRGTESAATRIQSPELESAVEQSQPQLVSNSWNSSQSWDGVSRNSYPAAGTRVSRRMQLAVTCIQPLELNTTATRIQPPELELDRISCNSYSAAFQKLIFQ